MDKEFVGDFDRFFPEMRGLIFIRGWIIAVIPGHGWGLMYKYKSHARW
jgi:hypothetical protein